MTEPKPVYNAGPQPIEHRHHGPGFECGYLIGVERPDGTLLRQGVIYYSLFFECPDCHRPVSWQMKHVRSSPDLLLAEVRALRARLTE